MSIHVLLAVHDDEALTGAKWSRVSIHVPLAEHDGIICSSWLILNSFNSRAPRGARLQNEDGVLVYLLVSIHVPLAEHDGL